MKKNEKKRKVQIWRKPLLELRCQSLYSRLIFFLRGKWRETQGGYIIHQPHRDSYVPEILHCRDIFGAFLEEFDSDASSRPLFNIKYHFRMGHILAGIITRYVESHKELGELRVPSATILNHAGFPPCSL